MFNEFCQDNMMDNHITLFENTNGSIYPSDLVLSIIEDASSSPPNSNDSLSSNQSLDISTTTTTNTTQMSFPCCILTCKPNSHPFQERCIPLNEHVKVGRAVARLKALSNNATFDCKVLSRQHAKLWYENGKVCHKIIFNKILLFNCLVLSTRHQKFQWNICKQSTPRQM
jgi:hypothetical protein